VNDQELRQRRPDSQRPQFFRGVIWNLQSQQPIGVDGPLTAALDITGFSVPPLAFTPCRLLLPRASHFANQHVEERLKMK
jgi:hypothetical protein